MVAMFVSIATEFFALFESEGLQPIESPFYLKQSLHSRKKVRFFPENANIIT